MDLSLERDTWEERFPLSRKTLAVMGIGRVRAIIINDDFSLPDRARVFWTSNLALAAGCENAPAGQWPV